MLFTLPRRKRQDPPASMAEARGQIMAAATLGLAPEAIARSTGHSLGVVRNVLGAPEQVPEPPRTKRRGAGWLIAAGIALAILAAGAAFVSYQAQFALVFAVKHQRHVSDVQAALPDGGALVFALLGIALALRGKRAIRARTGNLACVGLSVYMNVLAAVGGWSVLSVWVMAPTIYAFASDTLIGVIRNFVMREKDPDDSTPLQALAAFFLWLLRLAVDFKGTRHGFAEWVKSTPSAPPKRPVQQVKQPRQPRQPLPNPRKQRELTSGGGRAGSKTSRFIEAVAEKHGAIGEIPDNQVAAIVNDIAPQIPLDRGAATTALRKAIKANKQGVA